MLDELTRVLAGDERIAYALLFGSSARGEEHAGSDVDIAVGFTGGAGPTVMELGDLTSRLETVAGRPVDLVLLNEAPPAVACRVFRDGRVLLARDRQALVARKARAILEYLDFAPIEDLCSRGVLARRIS